MPVVCMNRTKKQREIESNSILLHTAETATEKQLLLLDGHKLQTLAKGSRTSVRI